jgi:hypothetical protein
MLMGMESPDNRREHRILEQSSRLMTPTGRNAPVGDMRPPVSLPLTQGRAMKRLPLPASLSIALWLTGSIWLVAIIGHLLDAPHEIVAVTLLVGVLTGVAEWLLVKRKG